MMKAGDCSSAFCYIMRATISEARQGRCIAPRRGFYHIRNMAIKKNKSSILLRGLLDSLGFTMYP